MRYEVVVKETHMKLVKVIADDRDKAKKMAEDRLYAEVLRTSDVTARALSVIKIKDRGGIRNGNKRKTATNRK